MLTLGGTAFSRKEHSNWLSDTKWSVQKAFIWATYRPSRLYLRIYLKNKRNNTGFVFCLLCLVCEWTSKTTGSKLFGPLNEQTLLLRTSALSQDLAAKQSLLQQRWDCPEGSYSFPCSLSSQIQGFKRARWSLYHWATLLGPTSVLSILWSRWGNSTPVTKTTTTVTSAEAMTDTLGDLAVAISTSENLHSLWKNPFQTRKALETLNDLTHWSNCSHSWRRQDVSPGCLRKKSMVGAMREACD